MPQVNDAERRRIEESRDRCKELASLGPLSQRAAMGHGARGLQPLSARRGITSPTIRRAAAPIAGARTASPVLRRPAALLPVARAVERPRSHPQGAAVRADQRRGQSRRGRQGTLLLSRRRPSYAYARMLYKLPQAAYPYEWLVEENARRAARRRWSSS
jgi:hypothetical protein